MTRPDVDVLDESFQRYLRLVRQALRVPHSALTFAAELRRELDTPVVATDLSAAHEADRSDLPGLPDGEGEVAAYAACPLHDVTGTVIGQIWALDTQPRDWTAGDLDTLTDLAAACSAEIARQGLRAETQQHWIDLEAKDDRNRVLLQLSEALAATTTLAEISESVDTVAREALGCYRGGIWLRDLDDPAQAPPPPRPAPGRPTETVSFVSTETTDWDRATRYAVFPIDESNPVGEALLERRVLLFPDQAAQNRRYPALAGPDQVGEARAFLPLVLQDQVLGTMVLLWPEARAFDAEDLALVTAFAAYTAQATQRAHLLQDRVDTALKLQNAMLTTLPEAPGLELAARYRPAGTHDRVGGDWYDAVVMPDGSTHLMVGDVVGHDVDAAAVMGQLRSMQRSFAWAAQDVASPARCTEQLDRSNQDLALDAMASVLHVRVHPDDGTGERLVTWSNAGHPPPLVIGPEGTARFLDRPHVIDPMLGVMPGVVRHDHQDRLEAGWTLVLYSDGLVERRGESISCGLERALALAQEQAGESPEQLIDRLVELLPDGRRDDVVVVAVRLVASPDAVLDPEPPLAEAGRG